MGHITCRRLGALYISDFRPPLSKTVFFLVKTWVEYLAKLFLMSQQKSEQPSVFNDE